MQIAEAAFSEEADLVEGVRTQLGGGATWANRNDVDALQGMTRAMRSAGKHKQLLATTVASFLGDHDLTVRTGAAAMIGEVAAIMGADYAAEMVEKNELDLDGVQPVGHRIDQPDLWWEALVGMARSVTKNDSRAIELFRANAAGKAGSWLLGTLAKNDADWLVDHAAAVVPPRSLLGILRNLPGRARREMLVRAIPWSSKTAAEALAKPWSTLPLDQVEIDSLRALIDAAGQ